MESILTDEFYKHAATTARRVEQRFYIKYSTTAGTLILDTAMTSEDGSEMLIVPYRITEKQGQALKQRVDDYHYYERRMPFLHEFEFQFYKIFRVCSRCDYVSNKEEVNKAWGTLCRRCFRRKQQMDHLNRLKNRERDIKLRKLRRFLKTPLGQIYSVPMEYTLSNLRIEMDAKGYNFLSLSREMGISPDTLYKSHLNKFISADILYQASIILKVPIRRFLKIRRGLKNPTKHGVPVFWLEEGYRFPKTKMSIFDIAEREEQEAREAREKSE